MVAATDAVWIDVLPSMKGFGPALAAGADKEAAKVGKSAGANFGKAALAATAIVATGAALATKALFNIGSTFQQVENTIRVGTGATGRALDDLTAAARNVGTRVPANFEDIGTAIADLNTRLGLTGQPLEDMAERFLELSRITGTDLAGNIASMTRVFGDWDVAAGDQAATLDLLFRASQATGIGVDELANKVVQFGSPLRAMGFSLEESAAMFGKFEKEGVNAELVIGSLRQGLGRMAKAGEDAPATFRRVVDEIAGMESRTEATAAAMELFGARAGPDMAAAIQEGRFELDELLDVIENGGDTIMDAAGDTLGFSEQWQMFKNQVMVDLAPLAKRVFDTITNGMTWMRENGIPTIRTFAEWVQRSSGWLAPLAAGIGTIVGALAAWTVVSKALNAVLIIKNALLAANPIGIVVVAIAGFVAALVTAYKTSDTFRAVVDKAWTTIKAVVGTVVDWFTGTAWPAIKGVWDGIAAGALWLWNSVIKPAWEGIRLAIAVVIEAVRLYWNNVLKPVWSAIAAFAMWLWNNGIKPYFEALQAGWQALVTAAQWAWNNILKPVWNGVAAVARWLWANVLRPVFDAIKGRWDETLRGMKWVWDHVLKPMFESVATGVLALRDGVRSAVESIGRAWEGIKRAFAVPVNWVIDNVINKFLGWVNRIAEDIGISLRMNLVPNVAWGATAPSGGGGGVLARNRGGLIPGSGPDRDSVLTHLTPGEYVWSRKAVDRVGPDRLALMHAAARNGDPLAIGDGPGGWLRDLATSALNQARKVIVDVARPGFDQVMRLMDSTVGQWGMPGQFAAGTSRRLGSGMLDWMAGIEKEADRRVPDLTSGIGWEAMWAAVRGAFPDAVLTSALRPGSITSSGNLSWHARGRAIDLWAKSLARMGEIARWISSSYGPQSLELISPNRSGGPNLWRGRPHTYSPTVQAGHSGSKAHVHWAYDQGGWLPPGVSQVANWTGKPEAVLTDSQWRTMQQAATGNDGPVTLSPESVADLADAMLSGAGAVVSATAAKSLQFTRQGVTR